MLRNAMIKVAVADSHILTIEGLKNMLSEQIRIRVYDQFYNGKQLLKGLKNNQPGVLILDTQLPDISGDELSNLIHTIYPDIRILIFTNRDQIFHVHNMMLNGALGYLLKNTDVATLVLAIETVYVGKQFIDPFMKKQLLKEMVIPKNNTSTHVLSRRESDILRLVANEYTSQEIADKLLISLNVVEEFRINLLMKLDAQNTTSLVKKATQMGLVK